MSIQPNYQDMSGQIERLFGAAFNNVQSTFERLIQPMVSYEINQLGYDPDPSNFLLGIQGSIPHFPIPDFQRLSQQSLDRVVSKQKQRQNELQEIINKTLQKVRLQPYNHQTQGKSKLSRSVSAKNSNVEMTEGRQASVQQNTSMNTILQIKENQFKLQLQQQQQQFNQQLANMQLQQQNRQNQELSKIKENLYRTENELNTQRQQLQQQVLQFQRQQQELQNERTKISQFKKKLVEQQQNIQEQQRLMEERQRRSLDEQQNAMAEQMHQLREQRDQFEQQFALERARKQNEISMMECELKRVMHELEERQRELQSAKQQSYQQQIDEQFIINSITQQALGQPGPGRAETTLTMNTGQCMDFVNFQPGQRAGSPGSKAGSAAQTQKTLSRPASHSTSIVGDTVSPEVIDNAVVQVPNMQVPIDPPAGLYHIPTEFRPNQEKDNVPVATWAQGANLQRCVLQSARIRPENVFGPGPAQPTVQGLFGVWNHAHDNKKRVTQNWKNDRLQERDVQSYYEAIGLR